MFSAFSGEISIYLRKLILIKWLATILASSQPAPWQRCVFRRVQIIAPMFLPPASRLTLLLMIEAHEKKHSGIAETLAQFRMSGFWTTQAAKLAKSIKTRCILCRHLDRTTMRQIMGSIPSDQLLNPAAWGHI